MSPADKDNQKVLKDSQALKQKYHKVCSLYQSRMKNLEDPSSDEKWGELATAVVIKKLKALRNDIDDNTRDNHINEFLCIDWSDFRKGWAKDMGTLYHKLRSFCQSAGPKINELDEELVKLTRCYNA